LGFSLERKDELRIYSSKTYIIWPGDDQLIPRKVDGQTLRNLVKEAALVEGDTVYEASVFAKTKEKHSIELIDAGGTPVEGVEEELGLGDSAIQ
jgi:hypothetical protein